MAKDLKLGFSMFPLYTLATLMRCEGLARAMCGENDFLVEVGLFDRGTYRIDF